MASRPTWGSHDDPSSFVLPNFNINSAHLPHAADRMGTALNVLGPQYLAKGFAAAS